MAHLPAEIIQSIQSLLTVKEAARSTLLCKSWYGAWATTPNLNFYEYELRNRLPQLAKKTLQRYEDLNLKIQSFRLRMYEKHSLARELISKAIELGATDLRIHVTPHDVLFILPDEVVESQTLTRLYASCCTVDLGRRKKEVIPCSNLKSLNLFLVIVNGDFFKDLSWRFPLIEELTLKQPMRLRSFDVGAMVKLHKLKSLRVESQWLDISDSLSKHDLWPQFPCLKELVLIQGYSDCNGIRICSPSLERIVILLCRAHGKVNAENLALHGVRVTSAFLGDLLRSCRPNFIYIHRNYLGQEEALHQLRRLPWKTNTFSSVYHPWDSMFAIPEGETLSDTQYVRFQLR